MGEKPSEEFLIKVSKSSFSRLESDQIDRQIRYEKAKKKQELENGVKWSKKKQKIIRNKMLIAGSRI